MYIIDRAAVVVRAKRPFLDWTNSLPDKPGLTLKTLNRENHIFLLPEHDTEQEFGVIVRESYVYVLQMELASSCRDESLWPPIDYQAFLKWFDLQVHSMVFDPYEDAIQKEEFLHY